MTPPPPNPASSNSRVAYEKALKLSGWRCIGEGAGGSVYHRAGDTAVIKVFENDDCYLAFADYSEKNPRRSLPILTVVHIGHGWAVTHIELLAEVEAEAYPEVDIWWTAYCQSRRDKTARPDPQEWSDVFDDLFAVASSGNCGVDVKPANVMVREASGEIVFTDPLFWLPPKRP